MEKKVSIAEKEYNILKFDSESDVIFNDRIEFIKKIISKYGIKDAIKLSKVYANIKYKKCKYDKKTYSLIYDFI